MSSRDFSVLKPRQKPLVNVGKRPRNVAPVAGLVNRFEDRVAAASGPRIHRIFFNQSVNVRLNIHRPATRKGPLHQIRMRGVKVNPHGSLRVL